MQKEEFLSSAKEQEVQRHVSSPLCPQMLTLQTRGRNWVRFQPRTAPSQEVHSLSLCNSKPLQNNSTDNYFPLLKTRDSSLARVENSQITALIPLPTHVESHPASQRATLCCWGAATARKTCLVPSPFSITSFLDQHPFSSLSTCYLFFLLGKTDV